MPQTPPPSLAAPSTDGLVATAAKAQRRGQRPPVELWNPPDCGPIDIRIAKDGTWFHEGTPIGRPAMVKLFASILKREGARYFLVTPVEKVEITVEDSPLHVQDLEVKGTGRGQEVRLRTLTDDVVTLGPEHALRVEFSPDTQEPAPYAHIHGQEPNALWARIDRKSFYRLVDLAQPAEHAGEDWLGLWSKDTFFPLIRCAELV